MRRNIHTCNNFLSSNVIQIDVKFTYRFCLSPIDVKTLDYFCFNNFIPGRELQWQEHKLILLVFCWRHDRSHVGWQEQRPFPGLEIKTLFSRKLARKNWYCFVNQHGCLVPWLQTKNSNGAPRASVAKYLRKFGSQSLPIQEILVITWPYAYIVIINIMSCSWWFIVGWQLPLGI